MYVVTRIHDMPVYATRRDEIDATLYNLWRRARLHLHIPIRIELPELKQMSLILEEDSWVMVDSQQHDLPVLAWVDFQDKGRSSLHTPVNCTLNYYHFMANQLRNRVVELMTQRLEEYLTKIDKP